MLRTGWLLLLFVFLRDCSKNQPLMWAGAYLQTLHLLDPLISSGGLLEATLGQVHSHWAGLSLGCTLEFPQVPAFCDSFQAFWSGLQFIALIQPLLMSIL